MRHSVAGPWRHSTEVTLCNHFCGNLGCAATILRPPYLPPIPWLPVTRSLTERIYTVGDYRRRIRRRRNRGLCQIALVHHPTGSRWDGDDASNNDGGGGR